MNDQLITSEVIFVNERNLIEKKVVIAPTREAAMVLVRKERPRCIITGARQLKRADDEFCTP